MDYNQVLKDYENLSDLEVFSEEMAPAMDTNGWFLCKNYRFTKIPVSETQEKWGMVNLFLDIDE
tara:strand:- start:1052 stop:1243 length:192 start_codon:yes stop_codon:yes gene_type:complete